MNITIEELRNRIVILQEQLSEILSKGNAISGAIQDCEYWISELEKRQENKDSLE